MAGHGATHEHIAQVVGTSRRALGRHYRDELALGRVKANAQVAENLFEAATGDGAEALPAAIFWLKSRAGWHA
jgi:hypothetical protein